MTFGPGGRAIWDGRAPLGDPAAAMIANRALIVPGCSVWSARRRRGEDPIGGVVLEVDEIRYTDAETGEIVDRRRYRVRDPYAYNRPSRWIDAGEILAGPEGAEVFDRRRCAVLLRRLCGMVRTDSAAVPSLAEADALADAYRLLAVLS